MLLIIAGFAPGLIPARLQAETDPAYGRAISSLGVAVNARTHTVYAVDAPHNVLVVEPEGVGPAHRIEVGQAPTAVAANTRTNRVYVVNKLSDSVSVVNRATDAIVATVQLPHGAHPYPAAVNEAANRVYVAKTYTNTLTVIDGTTNRAVELPAGNADGIAVNRHPAEGTGGIFLISYEGHDLRAVNPCSGAVRRVPLDADALGHRHRSGSEDSFRCPAAGPCGRRPVARL